MNKKPYSNIRVVELGSRIASAACGRQLADLGATVFIIEPRNSSAAPKGKWLDRISAVAAKESIVADPTSPDDAALVARLLQTCDVVIRCSDYGESDWPESWHTAIAECPIVCDITAYGSSGPHAGECSEEWVLQAMTGIMHTTGLPDGPPTPVGVPIIEMSSGLYAAAGILAALRTRALSGSGQAIEIALYDVAINTLTTFIAAHYAGQTPGRLGNGHSMAVPWNAYRTSDGWILICTTNDAQWNRLKPLIGTQADAKKYSEIKSRLVYREEIDILISEWTQRKTLDEIEKCLNENGIPCGRIVTVEALSKEPNLKQRGSIQYIIDPVSGVEAKVSSALFRFKDTPPSPVTIPAPDSARAALHTLGQHARVTAPVSDKKNATSPLLGLRVIEIGQLTTAPLAARHLATLGADVIKIEPLDGESARAWEPKRNDTSHFFVVSNGEKRNLALDLRSDKDRNTLIGLVEGADVLIENLKPGALVRLGLGADTLLNINPRLIYCGISGFGSYSAYPGRAAVDTVIQAMSGIMDTTRSNGIPIKAGISIADISGGQTGLLLVLAALAQRDNTGRGCIIDISMQDVSAWLTQHRWNGAPLAYGAIRQVTTIAQACTHPQTRSRELIQLHQDDMNQTWEVFGSPLRMSLTPPRIGRLIGKLYRGSIDWHSTSTDSDTQANPDTSRTLSSPNTHP